MSIRIYDDTGERVKWKCMTRISDPKVVVREGDGEEEKNE